MAEQTITPMEFEYTDGGVCYLRVHGEVHQSTIEAAWQAYGASHFGPYMRAKMSEQPIMAAKQYTDLFRVFWAWCQLYFAADDRDGPDGMEYTKGGGSPDIEFRSDGTWTDSLETASCAHGCEILRDIRTAVARADRDHGEAMVRNRAVPTLEGVEG